MRLRKIRLAMVILIICLLAGGLVFFYPKKVNNAPSKTNVSSSSTPKRAVFSAGGRNFSSKSSPVDNESFKKGIELACDRVDEIREKDCLQSTDLEDCSSKIPFSPKEASHILSLGPSLCKSKKTYACALLLKVLPKESPLRKEYEDELREDWNSRCQKGSDRHCRKLMTETKISPEEKAELLEKVTNNLQKKCHEGSTVKPRDCFLLAEFLNQSGQQERALLAKQRMKEIIHKKCENAAILSSDKMYCWLDVLDEPECLYSEEAVGCKKRYEELSDTEKNSPAYINFVQNAKELCSLHSGVCVLVDDRLPTHSADRAWAQNRWMPEAALNCQKSESVAHSECWTLYQKTKDSTDAHMQELSLDAKEHFLQLGMSACQKGDQNQCADFVFILQDNGVDHFTEELQQARQMFIELSQGICEEKRNYTACHTACHYGKQHLEQQKKN